MASGEQPADHQDDFELMRRIAQSDAGAIALLFDRYSGLVMAMGMRILRDRGEAEDFLIDVFWELWQRAERYDASRGAPVTYLMTLARSRAIDRQRSGANRAKTLEDSSEPVDYGRSASTGGNPADDAQKDERGQRIRQAMAQLEPGQRQGVEMSFFEGLSHSEIAAKLNKPLGTIKTNIRQGLIRLREILRNE